jgi:fluoroquinolone transport system permease protein
LGDRPESNQPEIAMNHILILSLSDLRSTFRDPIFKVLLFFPFMSFALVRWGLPVILQQFPAVAPYSQVILMWACLQAAIMFGFIYGFLFLEEKEENIWQLIRILPVAATKLVFARLLIGLLVSTLVNFCLIRYGQIIHIPFGKELLLSFQFSLAAPFIALLLGAFSQNRIEGLAQMKIINLLLMLPALIYFVPSPWMHLTALVPTYWSYRSLEHAADNADFSLYLLTGFVIYLLTLFLLTRKLMSE